MNPQHVLIWQAITAFIGGAAVVIAFALGATPANAFSAGSVLFITSFLIVMLVNTFRSRGSSRS